MQTRTTHTFIPAKEKTCIKVLIGWRVGLLVASGQIVIDLPPAYTLDRWPWSQLNNITAAENPSNREVEEVIRTIKNQNGQRLPFLIFGWLHLIKKEMWKEPSKENEKETDCPVVLNPGFFFTNRVALCSTHKVYQILLLMTIRAHSMTQNDRNQLIIILRQLSSISSRVMIESPSE